jgi:Nucleotidyltransferase of unknown function (DUF6036)
MLDRDTILQALSTMSDRLAEKGVRGEICLFGGAAMVLAFQTRQSTKDVDAIFAPTTVLREVAEDVAEQLGLPSGWFNDGVKGWVSQEHATTQAELPQFSNLSVSMPVPEYLLAMKCMAARAEAESRDFEDAKFLLRRLNLTDPQTAFELIEHYYPARLIPPRTRYFVEAAFDELKRSQP